VHSSSSSQGLGLGLEFLNKNILTTTLRRTLFIADRVSREGTAVGRVRPHVRLFPLCLLDELIIDTKCMGYDMARQGLKVKVKVKFMDNVQQ